MNTFRWTARIVGSMIVALVVIIKIGEGFNPANVNGIELAMSAVFWAALAGMIVLWRWEGIGGLLTLGGMLAFYGLNFAASGKLPGGWVLPLCYLPGVLALVCWSHDKWKLPPRAERASETRIERPSQA